MKSAHAQASTRSSHAVHGVARGARIQAKASQTGAGNHRRQRHDAFERQADELAQRIVYGETNVAHRVTRTRAAHFHLPGNQGRPLAPTVRQEMEKAFGADLGAVRIHTGAAATEAARENAAEAFASGRDIYFRDGRFHPETEAGRRLLAHELTHVLQQTGRTGTDGRLHANAVFGPGEVQCFPPQGTTPADAFDLLVSRYNNRATATDLHDTMEEVRTMIGSALAPNQPQSARPLADAVRTFQTRTGIARGFVVDCLKVMGFNQAAFQLLDADPRYEIQVGTAQLSFLQFLNSPPRGAAWIGDALRLPAFRTFWPNAIVRSYRDFFLQPHSPPPPENAELRDRFNTEWQRRNDLDTSSELVPHERVLLAWSLLHDIDVERVQACSDAHSQNGATTTRITATEVRARLLRQLRDRQQAIIDDEHEPAFRRLIAERLVAMAGEVLPLLEGAVSDYRAWADLFSRASDVELLAPASRFPHSPLTAPLIQSLHTALVAQATNVLTLDAPTGTEPTFPTAAAYSDRLQAFRDALEQSTPAARGRRAAAALFTQLDAAWLAAARARQPNRDTVAGLGLLSMVLDRVVQLTLSYDRSTDEATPHFPDELAAHRIRMARALAWVARWMQWDDLLALCRPALTADSLGQVQLWLLSDWEPDAPQPIDALADDFGENLNRPVIENTPLTIRHLVTWFHLDYNTRLRAVLRELVEPEDRATARTPIALDRILALQQTREEVRAVMTTPELEQAAADAGAPPALFNLRVPQRFTVREWEASFPPGASYSWDHVIATRPKTLLQLQRHRAARDYAAVIYPTRPSAGVFAWITPSLYPLIQLLRRIPSLQRIAGEAQVPDDQWLLALSQEQLSEDQWQRINETIGQRLDQQNRAVRSDLPDLWLRLNILRRRVLVMQLRPRIQAYVANSSVAYGPSGETPAQQRRRLQTPSETMQDIFAFQASVVPQEDADVQTTLLILQLADVLDGMVTPNRTEADFGRSIYPFLTSALGWLDGSADKRTQLQRGTNVYDEAGNIVYIDRHLQEAKTHLQNLKRAIDDTYREAQSTIGFMSEDGDTIKTRLPGAPTIHRSRQAGDRNEWTIDQRVGADLQIDESSGTTYRLLEVYRRFTYHPFVGSPGQTDSPGLEARFTDENGVEYPYVNDAGQTVPIPHTPLFRIEIGGVAHEVCADESALLKELNDTFLWRTFQMAMEDLGAETEAYMQWLMTAVGVLVPEVAYAEIGTTVIQLVVSGQIEELVRQMRDDPGEVLRRLLERLRDELFTPENVWRFILFSGQHNPFEALDGLLPTRPRAAVTMPPSSRLGRIVARLRQLGRQFKRGLDRVELYADGPIRSVEGFVAMRPTLAWMMRRAAHLFEAAVDLIPPEVLESVARAELPGTPQDLVAAAGESIADAGHDMETSTVRLLETIAHFELPYELLDLNAATELILGFVVDRFGPRARAVRLALTLIPIPQEQEGRFSGLRSLYQYLCAEVARVWRDSPVDPNVYWREQVIPLIGTKFTETRDDLVNGLYDAIDGFLREIGRPPLARPTGLPNTNVEAVQPEAETLPAAAPRAVSSGAWRVPVAGGAPMPAAVRRPLEGSLGQQFSHVRLHGGAEGRAATEPVGADALTSGSHVFVHPSRSLTGTAGRRLLAHELTHVVQQTGSHPFGTRRPAVRGGRPQRGLRVDPRREAQADAIASRLAVGRAARVAPAGPPPEGAQPSLSERMVNSVIDTLTTTHGSGDFTATVHGGSADHVPGIDVARRLWTATKGLIDSMTFAGFLSVPPGTSVPGVSNSDVHELIKQQVRDRADEIIGEHIPGIAQLAQRPRRNRTANDPETELNPGRFVNLLEDFIAAERGIGLNIRFEEATTTVSAMHAHNVLLQNVGGTSHLWKIAMYRSFSGHATDVPDLAKAQGEIRQRLRALPPTAAVYSLTTFEFSSVFVSDYLDLIRSRGRTVEDIPTVREYTNVRNNRADSLAVSTHGDLSGRGIGPYGRESHHTSQYLLVEFFGNLRDATRKAFPSHHANYPSGVEFKPDGSGEVAGIRSGGRYLNLATLSPDSGRGNNMPAILLAARTHRHGELHVLHEARWNPETDERLGTRTQGFAIENRFNGALPPDLRPHNDSDVAKQRFQAAITADPARANREFYNAAVAAYHWMYDRMIPALRSALPTEELAYYRGVAAIRHQQEGSDELEPGYRMTAADLSPVWDAAKRNNDHVMREAGWPAP
jgi:hypothetical protein